MSESDQQRRIRHRGVVLLALESGESKSHPKPVSTADVARAQKISPSFLAKIMARCGRRKKELRGSLDRVTLGQMAGALARHPNLKELGDMEAFDGNRGRLLTYFEYLGLLAQAIGGKGPRRPSLKAIIMLK